MDLTMPQVDGIDATRRIIAELPHVRVIGLSMHKEAELATALRQAGGTDYLTKGGHADQLVAAIRRGVSRNAAILKK
jgi:DNA-binding NarL/FixJ family response regulator